MLAKLRSRLGVEQRVSGRRYHKVSIEAMSRDSAVHVGGRNYYRTPDLVFCTKAAPMALVGPRRRVNSTLWPLRVLPCSIASLATEYAVIR